MSGLDVSLAVSHRYGSDKKFPNVKKSYIYIYQDNASIYEKQINFKFGIIDSNRFNEIS
jgi:hypothetical protein